MIIAQHGIVRNVRPVAGASYPTDGLLYRWQFQSDGTDSEGALNLTAAGTGSSYGAGKVGNAVTLNATAYFTATMSYTFSAISISVWFKSPSYTSAEAICRRNTDFMFQTELEGGKLFFQGNGSSGWKSVYTTSNVADNTWHHGVITWGSGTQKIYLDNDNEATTSSAGNISNGSTAFYVGQIAGGTQKWAGSLDQMYIYNKVLSTDEIAQLYNGGAGV
jgi:hypothetical protein